MATGWCVRVQPDYLPSLGRGDEFWVSYAEYSAEGKGKGEHCKVRTGRDGGLQEVEDGEIQVEKCEEQGLIVLHKSSGRKVKVQPAGVKLQPGGDGEGLDVSLGGLGVSCQGETVLVWDAATGTVRRKLEGHLAQVYTSRLFPSGTVVLSGSADMRLKVTSVEDGRCPVTLVGHTGGVMDTAIISKGKLVISVSRDGTARLWRLADSTCLAVIGDFGQVLTSCSLLPSSSPLMSLLGEQQPESQLEEAKGLLLAVGGEEGLLALIDVANKKTVYQTKLNSPVLAVSPLDVALLAGCEDGSLHRIELENEVVKVSSSRDSSSPITALLGSPSQDGLLVGRKDGTLTLHSETSARLELVTGKDSAVAGLAFDDKKLYCSTRDGAVATFLLSKLVVNA